MKTILRNFFSVLRRFKTASVLNVLGLSIAFVAFMLIMMQVNYDYTFDRSHPNADAIFRALDTAFSTLAWHAAQVIPVTLYCFKMYHLLP